MIVANNQLLTVNHDVHRSGEHCTRWQYAHHVARRLAFGACDDEVCGSSEYETKVT